MRIITSVLAALTIVAALTAFAAPADAAGRKLSAVLTGAAEVPGPGDPDGQGSIILTVNSGQELICFSLTVAGIAPVTAAHIHQGVTGVEGPVVVTLISPDTSGSCVSVNRGLAKSIRKYPQNYYVNVHNDEFPDGALRGQLSK